VHLPIRDDVRRDFVVDDFRVFSGTFPAQSGRKFAHMDNGGTSFADGYSGGGNADFGRRLDRSAAGKCQSSITSPRTKTVRP
jgi:hypothetical protein